MKKMEKNQNHLQAILIWTTYIYFSIGSADLYNWFYLYQNVLLMKIRYFLNANFNYLIWKINDLTSKSVASIIANQSFYF